MITIAWCRLSDISLIFVGIISVILLCLGGVLLYIWNIIEIGYLLWIFFSIAFINVPITNGVLSKRLDSDELGIGFGVLHSIKGLTFAIAPLLFAGLYRIFDTHNFLKTMPFLVALSIVVIFAFPILFLSLRKAIKDFDAINNVNVH